MTGLLRGVAVAAFAVATLAVGGRPALALDKLTLAVGQKGFWDTSFPYLGQEKGFFKEQGIELDIQWTDGGADTQQAVITGSIDIGIATGFLGTISAWAKHAPVIVLSSQMTGAPDLYWYVRADSPVKSMKDLEGKSVAFSRPGSSSNQIAAALAKAAGVNVKLVPAGGPAATLTQVMSGQLDAGWSAVPTNLNLVQEGKIRTIAVGNDAPGAATQTVRVNITNATVLNNRRGVLLRFNAAYKKTIDWAYDGADVPEMYGKFASVPPAIVQEMRTKYFPKTSVALNHVGDVDVTVKEAVESKRLDKPLTADQTRDMLKYVAELNK
jgi:NitT/TauT family transport system substrate-binding protein